MKHIILNKGAALIDDEDEDWLSYWRWSNYNGYAARRTRDNETWPPAQRFTVYMHKVILLHHNLITIDQTPDHIDRNSLNNQKHNLRAITWGQNNIRLHGYGKSKYKGVTHHSKAPKWVAQITHEKKNYYIGIYDTEYEAARAHDRLAKQLLGEFAILNFPEKI